MTEGLAEPKKFRIRQWTIAILLLFLGIGGVIFFFLKNEAAFPAATINLKLSKDEVWQRVDDWAKKVGYPTDQNIRSLVFDSDDQSLAFLQQTMGSDQAKEISQADVPVFYWSTRSCKEHNQELLEVDLSPSGQLVRLEHQIPNDRKVPNLSHEAAQNLAMEFVEKDSGSSIKDYKLIENHETTEVNRVDHTFVWESTNRDYKGAKPRISVDITGNTVNEFHYYMYLPEEWTRKYETMRTYNELLSGGTSIFALVFAIWCLFLFFKNIPLHQIRWKPVIVISGLSALANSAYAVNELPSALAGYDPQNSFSGFLMMCYGGALGSGLGYALLMLPLAATAEILYRKNFASNLSFESLLKVQAWGTKEVHIGLVAGYGVFGLMAGYQILFYLLGQQIGITSPLGVNSYKVLASTIPAISAIAVGIMASFTEEFLFRIVGLAFLQKFIKNFWIANILQAAIWAFLHCNYPQQPAYARGIELTVVGIGLGCLLRRFGLWPAVIAHFLFDIFVTVQILFLAPDAMSQASAYIAIFLLAAIAIPLVVMAGAAKSQITKDELLNCDVRIEQPEAKPTLAEEIHASLTIARLPKAARWSMATIIGVCLLSLFIPSRSIWSDQAPVTVDREHAIAYASEYLRKQGYNLDGKQSAAQLLDDTGRRSTALQYAYENVGLEATRKYAEKAYFPTVWVVRFFKPMQIEEYAVGVDVKGRIVAPVITIAEDAGGANLPKANAIQIAEKSIADLRPEFGKLAFSSISEVKRKNRTDYTIEFKVPSWKIADADCIVSATVLGDKLGTYSSGLNVPDKWQFEHSRKQPWNEAGSILKGLMMMGFMILILWSTVGLLKERPPIWKVVLTCGLVAGLCTVVHKLNCLPSTLDRYVTTTPWDNFVLSTLTDATLGIAGQFMFISLISILGIASLRQLVGDNTVKELPKLLFLPDADQKPQHAQMWLDASIIALTWFSFNRLCSIPIEFLSMSVGKMVPIQSFYATVNNANYFSGGLGYCFENLDRTVGISILMLLIIQVHRKFCKNKFVVPAVIVFYASMTNASIHYLSHYLIATGYSIVIFAVMYIGFSKIVRNNFAAFIAITWVTMPLPIVQGLGHYALPLYGFDFSCAALLASAPFVYTTYLWWQQRRTLGVSQPALGFAETK
ncbi:MAG: CPBP family intramembrane metalloprotease [Candidatus Obscuribacterales bacterium]|nr:CPBP family intramembrane metalloprotease [Candidatus Obscuribacterales bacterium]